MPQSASPVDPISDQKLADAFEFVKQLNDIAQRYEKLAPAQRTAAALKGLSDDANEKDVTLSAFIMQKHTDVRGEVRETYAHQQAPLLKDEKNRSNYMNSDESLIQIGKANAQDRFDRMFAATQSNGDSTSDDNSVRSDNNNVAPKKQVTFADQSSNQPNSIADAKTGPTKKTPPTPPDQSLKPTNRIVANTPATTINNVPFGINPNNAPKGSAPSLKQTPTTLAFANKSLGAQQGVVPSSVSLQASGTFKSGAVQNSPREAPSKLAKQVMDESALTQPKVGSKARLHQTVTSSRQ